MNTFCAYFNQGICRSCDLITLDYANQILMKEKALKDSLEGISFPRFESTVTSKSLHFRNKAKLIVTGTLDNPIIGLWGEEELDNGRELLNCPLHKKEINELLPHLKEFITLAKLVPYQIQSRTGELKGIITFYSETSNEMYLRFILRSKEAITRLIKYKNFLLDKIPHLKVISANIQPVPHAQLEGLEEIFLTEEEFIQHELSEVTMNLGPRAFVQTNQEVAEKLYQTAGLWVKELNCKKFLELYCGQGAFSFFCARNIQEGLGIEINEAAVLEGNKTAKKLNYSHLHFKQQDAALVSSEVKAFNPDLILVNPPRRGLAETVHLLLDEKPQHIIYSSCSYETLAIDLKKLKDYEIKRIRIFDMFPNTSHFETLVLLERKAI